MNVLILGAGGREHALAWKINQSKNCKKIYVAPGNGGTAKIGTNLSLHVSDRQGIKQAIIECQINMLVIGPEDPLVDGLVDYLNSDPDLTDLLVIGPSADGAQLEGSKNFAKEFMQRHGIPTARASVFNKATLSEGNQYLESLAPPYVLKADGLAAGKGVIITSALAEAKDSLKEMVNGQFGDASANVLIEEFLNGIELSVFVLTDGDAYVVLPEAKDYKRIGNGDIGPNTGGMGAVSPVGFADEAFMEKVHNQIIKPTVAGIKAEGFDYRGFIFIGLINVKGDPKVIEYNVRMGDPEAEVVMPRIKSDLLSLLQATAKRELSSSKIEFENFTATTVMLVSEGYPDSYQKGHDMSFAESMDNEIVVFHAGTQIENGQLKTNGGRVMAVTGIGDTMKEALDKSYAGIKNIDWQGMKFRSDIGFDLKRLGQ
jgi:phosphoribosylamine--glycine ligase